MSFEYIQHARDKGEKRLKQGVLTLLLMALLLFGLIKMGYTGWAIAAGIVSIPVGVIATLSLVTGVVMLRSGSQWRIAVTDTQLIWQSPHQDLDPSFTLALSAIDRVVCEVKRIYSELGGSNPSIGSCYLVDTDGKPRLLSTQSDLKIDDVVHALAKKGVKIEHFYGKLNIKNQRLEKTIDEASTAPGAPAVEMGNPAATATSPPSGQRITYDGIGFKSLPFAVLIMPFVFVLLTLVIGVGGKVTGLISHIRPIIDIGFFAIGLSLFGIGLYVAVKMARLKKRFVPGTAKIIGYQSHALAGNYQPQLAYTFNGQSHVVFAGFTHSRLPRRGRTLKILINPGHPTEVINGQLMGLYGPQTIFIVLGVLFMFFFVKNHL